MKLSNEENLDVDPEALDLIALNSDGSLRDAEMMLDQLSLLGKRITTSLVNDLVCLFHGNYDFWLKGLAFVVKFIWHNSR